MMVYSKSGTENDLDYLLRVGDPIMKAIYGIKDYKRYTSTLLGTHYNFGNNDANLLNKILIGLQQMEIDELKTKMENIEEKYQAVLSQSERWDIFQREENNIVYINEFEELVPVPEDLLEIIVKKKRFRGTIKDEGRFATYIRGEQIIAKIPKGLIKQLMPDTTDAVSPNQEKEPE